MRESAAKALSRKVFYEGCLPQWLTPDQISSAYFLTLLSYPARELQFIDAHNVPRRHVLSVERSPAIFASQQEARLGVSLCRNEMAKYLRSSFHLENRFQVLNLDIEGSFLAQLDPAMSSVLLFSWKNEDTVIATYSSIGRDRRTLHEGVLSLALFLSVAETETVNLFREMSERYTQAGYETPSSMVLRDLFWLRSILENTLVAGNLVSAVEEKVMREFLAKKSRVWSAVQRANRHPLRLGHLRDIGRANAFDTSACMHLELSDVSNMVYRAEPPWSQRCYFMKIRHLSEPIGLLDWTKIAMRNFLASSLLYIDRESRERDIVGECSGENDHVVVWKDRDIYSTFVPRQLELQPVSGYLRRAAQSLRERLRMEKTTQPTEGEVKAVAPANRTIIYTKDGALTIAGKQVVKEFAAMKMSVGQIQSLVPRTVPERVIRAYVAVAHRKPKSAKPKTGKKK